MAWVKLDDQFFVNRKARAVGPEGRALFLASVCYCGMQLNDGVFPERDVPVIAALAEVPVDVADRLFEVGLWHSHPNGRVEVHDYLKFNPSREQVVARRERAEKAAAARHATSTATSRASSNANAPPIPSPSPNNTSSSSSGNSRARPQPVDDDEEVLAAVPLDVWVQYAELMLARQPAGTVKQPAAWKRRTRENANIEHGDKAARWWRDYQLTPRYLAECLVDGSAPRGEYRRRVPVHEGDT